MKMKNQKFSKNITLKGENIETIQDFQYKTHKNFSATINIIVEEWDKYSIIVKKILIEKEAKELEAIAKAKVIKE